MAFLIVLNNKEPDFLMRLLLLFTQMTTFFFKFSKGENLNYLVVIFEELKHVLQHSTVFRKVVLNH
jgi:hypothetical protein